MLPIFSKPLETVTSGDASALVAEEYPEDGTVEFKERIPHKGGSDPWYAGKSIGDHGRNQLLEEVIAFPNAHGGHVILGVKESDDHPHRAIGVEPVPRCSELADVLRLQIRDCVEPQIPILHVRGVPTGPDGSGIVVIRVPQSRLAPHRLKATKECYFRHADRTEKMTMREIQDLTLQRARGTEGLEKRFAERQRDFQAWINQVALQNQVAVGCRITLIPTSDLYANDVYRSEALFARQKEIEITLDQDSKAKAFLPWEASQERPIVRGSRRTDYGNPTSLIIELHCTGLVEVCFRNLGANQNDARIFPMWVFGAACNGFLIADTFRKGIGAPDAEYAFEVELASTMTTVPIASDTRYYITRLLSESLPASPLLFPRMSLSTADEFPALIEQLWRDIYNSCGIPFNHKVTSLALQ